MFQCPKAPEWLRRAAKDTSEPWWPPAGWTVARLRERCWVLYPGVLLEMAGRDHRRIVQEHQEHRGQTTDISHMLRKS